MYADTLKVNVKVVNTQSESSNRWQTFPLPASVFT